MNENGKGEIAQYYGHFMTKFGYGTIIVPFLVRFGSISDVFGLAMSTLTQLCLQNMNHGLTILAWYYTKMYLKCMIRYMYDICCLN